MKIARNKKYAKFLRMNDIATNKAQLRQQMLQARQELPTATRLEAAESVKLHFADHPHLTYAQSFAGYYAVRGEVDILPIFNHMAKFKKLMALPRTHGQFLYFHGWAPGKPLEDGAYGIKVPPATSFTMLPEVILVPLLAFDDRGYRLGYGGGYYDRVIAALRQSVEKPPLFVGVAYDMQEAPALPIEPHDQKLDAILTNEGVSMF